LGDGGIFGKGWVSTYYYVAAFGELNIPNLTGWTKAYFVWFCLFVEYGL